MTYSVLKVPLNPNQPTNLQDLLSRASLSLLENSCVEAISWCSVYMRFRDKTSVLGINVSIPSTMVARGLVQF